MSRTVEISKTEGAHAPSGTGRPAAVIRRATSMALAALSGVLLVLAYPSVDAGWLGWVALVPLLVAIRRCRPAAAFGLGSLTGLVWFGGILYWLRLFGDPPFNTVLWLLAVLIEAAFVGLFAALVCRLSRPMDQRPPTHAALLVVPCVWSLTEWLRCTGPWGLPWGVLGETQAGWLALIQCADLGGVWLVSFLVAWVNAAVAGGMQAGRPVLLAPPALAVAAVLLYGALPRFLPDGPPLRVALVQADNDFGEYLERTRRAFSGRPDLVVWPETVVAGDPIANPSILKVLADLAREGRCALLAGAPHEDAQGRLKNAAVLVTPDGRLAGSYAKVHLVPFGEYIPFRPWIPFLDRFPSVTDMSPGDSYSVLSSTRDLEQNRLPAIGTMICFESTFPEIGRALVRDGAKLLAVLTSDAAFDQTSAPAHHATKAIFRAIETRRPVLQAATTGLTLGVDARGRVLGRLPMHRPGVLSLSIKPGHGGTLYTRLGDWVIVACAVGVAWIGTRRRM